MLSTTPADFVSFADMLEKALESPHGQHVAVVGSEEACSEAERKKGSLGLRRLQVFAAKDKNTNGNTQELVANA